MVLLPLRYEIVKTDHLNFEIFARKALHYQIIVITLHAFHGLLDLRRNIIVRFMWAIPSLGISNLFSTADYPSVLSNFEPIMLKYSNLDLV